MQKSKPVGKIQFKIVKSWNTSVVEDEKEKQLLGLSFYFTFDNSIIHTILIERKNVNANIIRKAIKDYYKSIIRVDEYEGMTGEFEPDEE